MMFGCLRRFGVIVTCVGAVLMCTPAARGEPFAPQTMTLHAPAVVDCDFEGDLEIPVTVSGTPAKLFFLVFTNGKAADISHVRNGFRGWHYVNKIDTCVYYDPGTDVPAGDHVVRWDGRDRDGNPVAPDTFTYYLFAYDNQSPKQRAIPFPGNSMDNWPNFKYADHEFVARDPDGFPLSKPLVYIDTFDGDPAGAPLERLRWHIGDDPERPELKETCIIPNTFFEHNLQPDPYKEGFVFTMAVESDSVAHIRRYEWVTGGTAVWDTEWGTDGEYSYVFDAINSGDIEWDSKRQSFNYIGDDLFVSTNTSMLTSGDIAELKRFSALDGTVYEPVDLSQWWIRPEDEQVGGQKNGGPNQIHVQGDYALLGAYSSCLLQCMYPTREDWLNVVWMNGNGDIVGDRNYFYKVEAPHPWACFDYTSPPLTFNISSDAHLFTLQSAHGLGTLRFILYAPDGTGIGNYRTYGDGDGYKCKIDLIDVNGPYDGIYMDCTDEMTSGGYLPPEAEGLFHVAHDSFKGVISPVTSGIAYDTSAPDPFTSGMPVPNPFNAATVLQVTVHEPVDMTVEIFAVSGQRIAVVHDGPLPPGNHRFLWDGRDDGGLGVASGTYIARIAAGETMTTRRMTLVK